MQTTKRKIEEMANMYGLPDELYTMKRGVKTDGGLRYDITEIPAGMINGQYNKTKGHVHNGYQELYIVLEGHAYFLFQKDTDFYYIEAKKGQCVIVPGDYHHVTVNVGRQTLILANWLSDKCKSDYRYLETMNGLSFYLGKNWSRNPKYKNGYKLRSEQAIKLPNNLEFLNDNKK